MERVWHIRVEGETEGPFSLSELKRDRRVTPQTLVWREGMDEWQPAWKVPELKRLFEREEIEEEETQSPRGNGSPGDDMVLLLDKSPPNPTMWLLVCLIIIFYMILRLYFF